MADSLRRIKHHQTEKEAVNAKLNESDQRRKQLRILSLFGSIDYSENYDYKRARRSKGR